MIDVSKKGKGALVRGEDPRDVPYSSLIFGAPVVNWDKGFDVEENLGIKVRIDDQGSAQSCVAQAWSKYGEVVDYVETRQIPDLSARDIYSRIFVPPDGGAYGYKGERREPGRSSGMKRYWMAVKHFLAHRLSMETARGEAIAVVREPNYRGVVCHRCDLDESAWKAALRTPTFKRRRT